jgi:hypothetical protein
MGMLDGLILQSVMNIGVTIDDAFLARLKMGILTSLTGHAKPMNMKSTEPL